VHNGELIDMMFALWTQTGPRNHVLDGSPEILRDIAMATSFGTQFAVTGFVRTMATRQLVMEGGLSGWLTDCRCCQNPAPKGRCHGNHFLAFDGL